jgi:hypothetical protein
MKLKKIQTKRSYPKQVESSMPGPCVYISSDQMPEMKDWEVGETYQLVIEVVQKSKTETENSASGEFELVAYNYMPKKEMEDMTDEEFGELQSEIMAKGNS